MRRRFQISARWNVAWLVSAILLVSGCVPRAFARAIVTGNPRSGFQQARADEGATGRTSETTVLDRVVAVVDGQAILASDVDDEMRFAALQSGNNSPADSPRTALNRVIDRALIDQQRALQPGVADVSAKEVDQAIANLRSRIPGCAQADCKTAAGWRAFLAAHGFTESEVRDRIRERLAILRFIDLRFGVAVRVSNAAIQDYFDRTLKPELEKNKSAVPKVASVAPRIREILRQQQVDAMVDQWLKSLHNEEQVRILDSAYGNGESGQ
jgi:peptidyl-prolyl cis-trans isomerase SurA